MQRRSFLTTSLALPSAVVLAGQMPNQRPLPAAAKFTISLKADAIGVDGKPMDLLKAATKHGYGALSVPAQWLEGMSAKQKDKFAKKAESKGITWGANGLPVEFRKTEAQFKTDLGALPMHAKNLRSIGVDRIGTWLISSHDELTYNENMEQHANRLRDTARILKEEGIKLGLEYLGTTALRHSRRFAFLSSGRELKELIALIGEPNVGVILDSYHWYTAREGEQDLMLWSNEEIVAVDLNDANSQLTLDQQTDVARELPGATGVIDLDTFVKTLVKIGYDGPVRAEPFSRTLNLMDNELAMAATYAAMTGCIQKALG